MQLTDKIFKGLYRRGVMLEQMKEPALSRTVKQMEPAEPCENPRDIDALSPEEILRATAGGKAAGGHGQRHYAAHRCHR